MTPEEIKRLAIRINDGSERGYIDALTDAYMDAAGPLETATRDSIRQKISRWTRGAWRPMGYAMMILYKLEMDQMRKEQRKCLDGISGRQKNGDTGSAS